MKLNVLGWYDKNNIGDESYKITFPLVFPGNEFHFFDQLNSSDTSLILGGGNVLNKEFLEVFNKIDNKKLCVSVGATETHNINSNQIYVRDINSLKLIPNSKYIPDLAFALTPNKDHGKELIKKLFKKKRIDLYEKIIICCPNSHLCDKRNSLTRDHLSYEKFCFEMAKLADETSASFIFLPFCRSMPWDDRTVCYNIASKCHFWNKNIVISDELDVQDVLDIISASTLTINQRLHATIFSCISEVPFIDIVHHDKNKSFLETIERKDLMVSYWDFSPFFLKEKINQLFINLETEIEKLHNIAGRQKAILKEVANDICFY
jgi:polysaccharide pyruvyl transferase WcaK-like protein